MARRHASQQDFELVGMASDPTPGDPDLIQGVVTRYRDVGDAAEKALDILRKDGGISRGRGSAVEALQKKIGDDLPDKLQKTATSYHDAAQAYSDYIPRLQESQETFDRAVDQAAAAAPQAAQVPSVLGENPTDEEQAAARRQQDSIAAGRDALNAAKSLAQQAKEMRESAQRQCADVLDRAASEAIPERSIFQKIRDFFADFPFVKILLGILIAIVAVFFPVAGALLGGALFALDTITAIATGHFSLGEFATGLLSLAPGGSLLKAGGAALKGGVAAGGGLAAKGAKSVGGAISGVKSSLDKSRTVGGFLNGPSGTVVKKAGEDFAEGAGEEAVNQAVQGDGFDVGAVLGAGALGVAGGGLLGAGAKKLPFPQKGPARSTGPSGGTGTRSAPAGDSAPATAPAPAAPAPATTTTTGTAAPTTASRPSPPRPAIGPANTSPFRIPATTPLETKQKLQKIPLNNKRTGIESVFFEKRQGSHSLARHSGRTEDELRDRLAKNQSLVNSSTFKNKAVAEKAVLDNLKAHQSELIAFLNGPPPKTKAEAEAGRLDITIPADAGVGTVVRRNADGRGTTTLQPNSVLTVLERDPDGANPTGFKIITSYPKAEE